jgi:hypothetical protein
MHFVEDGMVRLVTPISFHITFLDEKNSSNFYDLHRFLPPNVENMLLQKLVQIRLFQPIISHVVWVI